MEKQPLKQERRWWIEPLPELPPQESHVVPGGPITQLEKEVFERFDDAGWFYREGIKIPLGEIDVLVFWNEKSEISVIAWLPVPHTLCFDWSIKFRDGNLIISTSDQTSGRRLMQSEKLCELIKLFMQSPHHQAEIGTNYVLANLLNEQDPWGKSVTQTIALTAQLVVSITTEAQKLNLLRE
jgi:hypothetical protein